MKTIDIFPFFDEIDLLLIRLRYLSSVVDLFIISEFDTSFSGKPKGFLLEENWDLFEEFHHKIIYRKQTQEQSFEPFENDRFQKDSIAQFIFEECTPSDLLLFGDLDEIPKLEAILSAQSNKDKYPIMHFAQDPFSVYLNLKETSGTLLSHAGDYGRVIRKKWLGTVAFKSQLLESFTLTELREPERKDIGFRIRNAGWHFSYAGGFKAPPLQRLKFKLSHSAHQEFNNEVIIDSLETNLRMLKDPFGRPPKRSRFGVALNSHYKKCNPQFVFPDSLCKIILDFPHLILK